MTKRVLDVGNCDLDHGAIRDLITTNFDAAVTRVHSRDEALAAMRRDQFDLILINRKLDRDNTDGIDIIREMKTDQRLSDLPVMLITNLPDHQQQAIRAGAAPGFGKAKLEEPVTREILGRFLSAR